MNVIRDILDKQLVDCNGRNMGKIDGLIAELRENKPPRIACIEIGAVTLSRRFSNRLARRVKKWYSRCPAAGEFRIPWSNVCDVGVDIEVDLKADETEALAFERWLAKNVICRIPGA